MSQKKITETNQLFEWYHVPGGCPKCKKPIVGAPSLLQKVGEQNMQATNCPNCNVSVELIIAENRGGKLVPADLTLKPGTKNRPEAYQMIARESKTIIINPAMLGQPADA